MTPPQTLVLDAAGADADALLDRLRAAGLGDPEARLVPAGVDEGLARLSAPPAAPASAADAPFRTLFERSPDPIVVVRPDGVVLDANAAACALHRIERERLVGGHLLELVPTALHQAVLEGLDGLVRGDLPYADAVVLDTDGNEIHVEIRANTVDYGGTAAVLLHVRDTTTRRQSEDALRRREALLRTVVENAPVVLFAIDADGTFTLADGRGLDALGSAPGQAVGRNATVLYRRLDGFDDAWRRALGGETVARTFSHVRGRHYETWFTPDGTGHGVIGVAADVTDVVAAKREAERLGEQLRSLTAHLQDVREEERTRIAREVHDVLGQALTAIRMDAAHLARTIPDPTPDVLDRIGLMKHLVDETITTVRRIATDLRPGILDDLGLGAAIEWEAKVFAERSGTPCALGPVDEALPLAPDQATALFRVFQELLTNVARHAGATRVTGSLTREGDAAVLRVADDGRGIRPEDQARPDALGLLGMRERVRPWGGTLAFDGAPGAGTTATVRLPLGGDAA